MEQPSKPDRLNLVSLLRPQAKWLALALAAVIGEGAAGLLQPWPMKLLFDHVSDGKQGRTPGDRWLPPSLDRKPCCW